MNTELTLKGHQNSGLNTSLPLNRNPPAKFDVCSFILTGDNRGVQKFKSKSRDLGHASFGPIFSFFV